MPNSDNAYGVYNKQTQILTQTATQAQLEDAAINDGASWGTWTKTNFADVDAAKQYFYTSAALTVFDECCTQLQWSVENDGDGNPTQLKYTMAFGTKGGDISADSDWAGQFNSRKQALINSNGWSENPYTTAESDSHLF